MPSEEPAAGRDWRAWIAALGPGAIVASLTIGTGELIFSTRAGALFGYGVLGWFALVLLLKWALVFASARYWVLSDVHPLRRWAELPGPRGWLPLVLLLLAVPAFPIWVSFHSGTIGTLLAALTGTRESLGGSASIIWGIAALVGALILSATGGYARQERIQTVVVAAMVVSVIVAVVRLRPDWSDVAGGFVSLGGWSYPDWARSMPEFANRPAWVETATYAGVIGGSGYDYLAYVAWLRDKHGPAAMRRVPARELVRMVAADATVSFVAVLVFSAAFVICGSVVLGPRHQVPGGSDLLTLQAQFVEVVGTWLKPLYFTGALLALGGTLYGTIEVAPAVLRELIAALNPPDTAPGDDAKLRRRAVAWCGCGALAILLGTLVVRAVRGTDTPLPLVAFITPANLLTGVLACGWISLLNVWTDRRFLPVAERMNGPVAALNLVGGVLFCGVGLKAAWDQGRWIGPAILAGTLIAGWLGAAWWNSSRRRSGAASRRVTRSA